MSGFYSLDTSAPWAGNGATHTAPTPVVLEGKSPAAMAKQVATLRDEPGRRILAIGEAQPAQIEDRARQEHGVYVPGYAMTVIVQERIR